MGKIVSLFRLGVLLLSLLLCSAGHAKVEFPPELNSEADYQQFAARIRMMLPEVFTARNQAVDAATDTQAKSGIVGYLRWEQDLIKILKADEEYMRLADQRPPLQVLSFKQVTERTVTGRGTAREWKTFLERNDFRTVDKNVLKDLTTLLEQWPKSSLIGFFSGWAGLLSKEDRSILKGHDAQERWDQIKNRLKGQDLAELRNKFKAEKFGVQNKEWTWKDLDRAVAAMIALENRIAVLMQQLNLERSARNEAWFHAENLSDWAELPKLDARAQKLLDGLKEQLAAAFTDANATITQEVPSRELVIRELPPYLAIYRGCIGNDCSTGASWAFPYGPMERNFWVETTQGERLGYVSGAITRVNGKPALYLRDITGPGLTAEDMPFIINGFFMSKAFFGVEQVTIMHPSFTGQNHFPQQVTALHEYGSGRVREVNQTFADERIRIQILGTQLSSGLSYDNPVNHTTVRMINPSAGELAAIRVSRTSGGMKVVDPNKDPEALWDLLQDAVNSNNPFMLESSFERKVNWKTMTSVLRNVKRLPVEEFYNAVEAQFEANKLPFSRNMMKKNEMLFLQGHLAAPDAFEGDNVRQSVRYVMDLFWRRKGMEQEGQRIVQEHLALFEENELFVRNVRGMFARRMPDDLARAEFLFLAGYRFTKVELSADDWSWSLSAFKRPEMIKWMVEKSLSFKANLKADDIDVPVANAIALMLNNEDESIDESISIEAARKFYEIEGLLSRSAETLNEVTDSLQNDDNPQILVPLAMAYLRDVNAHAEYIPTVRQTLHNALDNEEVPSEWIREARRLAGPKLDPENGDGACERSLRPKTKAAPARRRTR